jgi:hypothetical protein
MTYEMHGPIEEAKPGRPLPVLLAAGLLALAALLGVVAAITHFVASANVVDAIRLRALSKGVLVSDVDDFVTGIRTGLIVAGLVTLLFSLLLLGLAFGLLRGSNAARVATWVLCALGLLWGCCGLCGAISTATDSGDVTVNGGDNSSTLLAQSLVEALPGWYSGIFGGSALLQALSYIAVAVLLALPSANAYFRKRPRDWQPPAPGMMPPYPSTTT